MKRFKTRQTKTEDSPSVKMSKLQLRILKLLVEFARPVMKEISRYSLGSWIANKTAYFTDGHWGFKLAVNLPDGQINPEAFRAASRPKLEITEDGKFSYSAPAFEILTPPSFAPPNIQHVFDNTEKAIKAEDTKHSVLISPKLLLAVAKMAVAAEWEGVVISIPNQENGQPVYFQERAGYTLDREPGAAIIMPMRF